MNAKRLFFSIMMVIMVTSLLAISPTIKVQACPSGTCEPVFEWQTVSKVITGYTCPGGFYFDATDSSCHQKNNPGVIHPNPPTPIYGCPAGSEPYGSGCGVKVQTGWNCNCGVGTHPDGNGNCVPDVPPTCPVGQVGTYPDCHIPTCSELGTCCPVGQIGTPPDGCHVPTCIELGTCCPDGQIGVPPDGCHTPTCEELGNCPTPKCTFPGLEHFDLDDPNCQEPNDPGDPIDPVILVDPPKQDWTWPDKTDIPACAESRHELTWDQMMPTGDTVNAFYSLTVRCQDSEVWGWDYQIGGWSCDLPKNQILVRISKEPFSVMWGGILYPAMQLPTGEWILSSVADHGKGYVFKGTHSGIFSWDMFNSGQLELFEVTNYFVDTPPQWPGIDISSYWKPYSQLTN